ncbi:hypothetical protein MTO96_015376 [Rhipicephalus appendiculatus]
MTALNSSQVRPELWHKCSGNRSFPTHILWFKDSDPNAVYSVDVNPRTGSLSLIRQSTQHSSLQGRAYFSVIQTPAVLSVERLRHADNRSYARAPWTSIKTKHGKSQRASSLLQALSRTAGGHPRTTLFRLRLTRADHPQARLTYRPTDSSITQPVATTVVVNMHRNRQTGVPLRLGSGLSLFNTHEGIVIYFEYSVHSNSPLSEVSWTFDGRDLHINGSRSIIVSNQFGSALRKPPDYACHAVNSESEADSNSLWRRVLRKIQFCFMTLVMVSLLS